MCKHHIMELLVTTSQFSENEKNDNDTEQTVFTDTAKNLSEMVDYINELNIDEEIKKNLLKMWSTVCDGFLGGNKIIMSNIEELMKVNHMLLEENEKLLKLIP